MGLGFAFGFLVERYDHLLEVSQGQVDGFGLGEDYAFGHGARHAFGPCEVDQVYLGVDLSKRADIFAPDVESEDAVGPAGGLVEIGGVDLADVVAHHMVVQSLLLVDHRMHADVLHLKVALLVLHKDDLSYRRGTFVQL